MRRALLTAAFLAAAGGSAVACQGIPLNLARMTISAAIQQGLPPAILLALVCAESSFNPNALSPVKAMGLGQLMPGTALDLGVSNPWDPQQNLSGSARYLRQQLVTFKGVLPLALAAYNAGAGTVQRAGGVPNIQETVNYVNRILVLTPLFEQVWRGWAGLPPVAAAPGVSRPPPVTQAVALPVVREASQVATRPAVAQVTAARQTQTPVVLSAAPSAVLTASVPVLRPAASPVSSQRPVVSPATATLPGRTGKAVTPLTGSAPLTSDLKPGNSLSRPGVTAAAPQVTTGMQLGRAGSAPQPVRTATGMVRRDAPVLASTAVVLRNLDEALFVTAVDASAPNRGTP